MHIDYKDLTSDEVIEIAERLKNRKIENTPLRIAVKDTAIIVTNHANEMITFMKKKHHK